MLSLKKISAGFFGKELFRDVSFVVTRYDRFGLVGLNGTGKSTLLKIIADIQPPSSGSIEKARYFSVGYLPQEGIPASGRTLYEEAESVFDDILTIQNKIEEIHNLLTSLDATAPEYKQIIDLYGDLQHKLEEMDAFCLKSKIERILMGLGFSIRDFRRNTAEFSGGWLMRIAIAKLLLQQPSLLLLDEPTNHLDLDSLQWLEEYLQNYDGSFIIVSHDQTFLDVLTTKTIAIEKGTLAIYAGNFSQYEKQVELRREQNERAFQKQQRQLAQTQRFIDRFRYKATKARQVQSRLKRIDKIEPIRIEEDEKQIHFHFPRPQPSGAVVIKLKNVCKNFDNTPLFKNLNCSIERHDRIAVVGVNGAGKTTFARILAGVESIDSGERIAGHNLLLSYFVQNKADELDPMLDVYQTLDNIAEGEIRFKLRTLLGAFLFHGDDIYKKVGVLSGGEKSRLALARMLLKPANFLIMDEPTNHLDRYSKKILQDALLDYEGSFVIVSHDRAFLDKIVNKVIEFSGGNIRTYPGTLSEYIDKKQAERQRISPESAYNFTNLSVQERKLADDKYRKRIEAETRQELYKKLLPLKNRLKKIENEISQLESRKREIETLLTSADFFKLGDDAKKVTAEYRELKTRLESLFTEWIIVSEEKEKIESANK